MITGIAPTKSLSGEQIIRLAKIARDVKRQTGIIFSLRDPELLTKLLKVVRRDGTLETLQELIDLQQELNSEKLAEKNPTIVVEKFTRHGVRVKYFDMSAK